MEELNPPIATATLQKRPMPRWFKVLAGLSLVALAVVMGGILFTERWVEVIDDHLTDLKQHNINHAYYNHTSKDFQAVTSFDSFIAFTEDHPILTNHLSAHFTDRSINQHISTLSGKITSIDHHSFPIEYRLIREDGEWKILSIRFLSQN